jgi:hypothetical protein
VHVCLNVRDVDPVVTQLVTQQSGLELPCRLRMPHCSRRRVGSGPRHPHADPFHAMVAGEARATGCER